METARRHPFSNFGGLDSPLSIALLVCLVAALSYFGPRLEWALMLHPQTVWPLWPSCALLVALLVLVPRRIWPILIPISFASIVLFDLQMGVPISSIAWFIPADTVEVLLAALCLSYFFDGVPQLNSVKAVGKYLFFAVILAPSAAAFVAAPGIRGDYSYGWRVCFLSEVLAFLTLTPAILSWVTGCHAWVRKSLAYHLEEAALFATLLLFAYLTFVPSGSSSSPALLYSLVPFLLWSALRFGSRGVSTSMIVVIFPSIWGAVHGRGPFTGAEPFDKVLSLQLFLLFAATPFMLLAALVEERKRAEEGLRESEERLRLAVQAGRMYAFEWDTVTDVILRSGQCATILSWMDHPKRDTGREFAAKVHSDDREAYTATEIGLTPENPTYKTNYRVLRPDGSTIWLEESGHGFFDGQRRMLRIVGMVSDVTKRKFGEEALSSVSRRLIEVQDQERFRIARELHDDLSQRMALLQINLEQFEQKTAGLSTQARQQLHKIAEGASEVSSNIHDLSHQLHPPNLDTLGLVISLRGLCKEFSEQHNLQVQFVYDGIPGQIPKDVTLCLFRVMQEALRNVVKHSGAAEARVELSGHGDRIDLCISDSGTGFNPESAQGEGGLGLVSMRERLRLIGGDLTLESEPLHGTRIRVRTPLLTTSAQVASEPKARKTGA
jgi:PAS domain S-box-containing protein